MVLGLTLGVTGQLVISWQLFSSLRLILDSGLGSQWNYLENLQNTGFNSCIFFSCYIIYISIYIYIYVYIYISLELFSVKFLSILYSLAVIFWGFIIMYALSFRPHPVKPMSLVESKHSISTPAVKEIKVCDSPRGQIQVLSHWHTVNDTLG